jgi:hypothetical protein
MGYFFLFMLLSLNLRWVCGDVGFFVDLIIVAIFDNKNLHLLLLDINCHDSCSAKYTLGFHFSKLLSM